MTVSAGVHFPIHDSNAAADPFAKHQSPRDFDPYSTRSGRTGTAPPYPEVGSALNFDSSPSWKTILPPIRSPFRKAQPRPEHGSISSLPSNVNTTAGLLFRSVS